MGGQLGYQHRLPIDPSKLKNPVDVALFADVIAGMKGGGQGGYGGWVPDVGAVAGVKITW